MSTASKMVNRSLKLKCSHDEVEKLHHFLRDSALDILGKRADEELIHTIILAVHEAFTNIVRHAYVDGSQEEVQLRCIPEKKGIAIELIDHGVEFNPFEQMEIFDANLIEDLQDVEDLNELDESKITGGYGIPIIQAAATSTKYRRSTSGDNHLYIYFQAEE